MEDFGTLPSYDGEEVGYVRAGSEFAFLDEVQDQARPPESALSAPTGSTPEMAPEVKPTAVGTEVAPPQSIAQPPELAPEPKPVSETATAAQAPELAPEPKPVTDTATAPTPAQAPEVVPPANPAIAPEIAPVYASPQSPPQNIGGRYQYDGAAGTQTLEPPLAETVQPPLTPVYRSDAAVQPPQIPSEVSAQPVAPQTSYPAESPTGVQGQPAAEAAQFAPAQPGVPQETQYRRYTLDDGSLNIVDDQGRVVLTQSADGTRSRQVAYGDPNNADVVTEVIIDGTNHYVRNADRGSWTMDTNGNYVGIWYGDIKMSRNGEYSFDDSYNGEHRVFANNVQEIVSERIVGQAPEPCYSSGVYDGQAISGNRGWDAGYNGGYSGGVSMDSQTFGGYRNGTLYVYGKPYAAIGNGSGGGYSGAEAVQTGCGTGFQQGSVDQYGRPVQYDRQGRPIGYDSQYNQGSCSTGGYDSGYGRGSSCGGGGYGGRFAGSRLGGDGAIARTLGQAAVMGLAGAALNRSGLGYGYGGFNRGYGGYGGGGYGGYGGFNRGYGGGGYGIPFGGYGGGGNNFGRAALSIGIGSLINRIGRRR
jgi:hypothetical protein